MPTGLDRATHDTLKGERMEDVNQFLHAHIKWIGPEQIIEEPADWKDGDRVPFPTDNLVT
ncbi:hypothetical protein [Rhodopirellula islandica]|nr:hypothetical protein [Rhodopirellula islandica]